MRDAALSWRAPAYVDPLAGAALLHDGPPVRRPALAIARAILHTNHRIAPLDALDLALRTVTAAHDAALPPEFLAATLLQESAYDPRAVSVAGAVGIAQFMPDTADTAGVNPLDPYDAIDGAARLLGDYVRAYRGRYAAPFAAALAAYNAGPGAVRFYHGVPPYAQTREYVADIADRWAQIAGYEVRTRKRRAGGE